MDSSGLLVVDSCGSVVVDCSGIAVVVVALPEDFVVVDNSVVVVDMVVVEDSDVVDMVVVVVAVVDLSLARPIHPFGCFLDPKKLSSVCMNPVVSC